MRRYWHPLPTVSLYPLLSLIPASYFPLWIHPRTLHLQLWMEPITRFLSHISQGHEKASAPPPASPLRTPPCSAMKWHPYLINCESWNFAQETPFLCTWQWLNCTAMQFHSPRRWEEKGAGEGLCTVLLVCVCVCVCVCVREMKVISLWHHGPPLNGTATEGPFCASRPRGRAAQWDPTADL